VSEKIPCSGKPLLRLFFNVIKWRSEIRRRSLSCLWARWVLKRGTITQTTRSVLVCCNERSLSNHFAAVGFSTSFSLKYYKFFITLIYCSPTVLLLWSSEKGTFCGVRLLSFVMLLPYMAKRCVVLGPGCVTTRAWYRCIRGSDWYGIKTQFNIEQHCYKLETKSFVSILQKQK